MAISHAKHTRMRSLGDRSIGIHQQCFDTSLLGRLLCSHAVGKEIDGLDVTTLPAEIGDDDHISSLLARFRIVIDFHRFDINQLIRRNIT